MTGLLSWLFGCTQPPTLDQAFQGKVELEPADRAAIEQLLASSSVAPSEVRLIRLDETSVAEPFVQIDDGRVTRLALGNLGEGNVGDASAVQSLTALREVSLTGSFEVLRLDGLELLSRLTVLSTGKSLQRLELTDLPTLRELSIHGANLQGGVDLQSLKLRSLGLTDCGLNAGPHLDGSDLTDLFLSGNALDSLGFLDGLDRLERLHLSNTEIESMAGLPRLPALRWLSLANNPLHADTSLNSDLVPLLRTLDVSRTGLRAAPIGLRDRDDLRLKLEAGVADALEFEKILARLRNPQPETPGELVTRLSATSGTIRGSSGRCSWKTSSLRRARVSCRLSFESVRGTAMARLGEVDLAMPFQGGGAPRVVATLHVGQGEAAIYVRQRHDFVVTAQQVTGVPDEIADAARQPGDVFEGYRRVVALPGSPARVEGEVAVLGSKVVLFVESVAGEARNVELVVESI